MKLPILTFKGWMKDHVTNIIVFVCFPVLSAPHAPPVFCNQHIYFSSRKDRFERIVFAVRLSAIPRDYLGPSDPQNSL